MLLPTIQGIRIDFVSWHRVLGRTEVRAFALSIGGQIRVAFFKASRCSKSLAFSVRNRRISASSSSTLRPRLWTHCSAKIGLALGPCPAIEQRCSNSQLGRYFGRAASTGTPQLQCLLLVLIGVSRYGCQPAYLTCVFMWASSSGFDPLPTVRQFNRNPNLTPFPFPDPFPCFNRGPGGAAKILQMALGVKVDGGVGPRKH